VMTLDHEQISEFHFHVKVSDLGKPRLSSETVAKVEILVTDVNDCAPRFLHSVYNTTLLLPTYKHVAILQVSWCTGINDRTNKNSKYIILKYCI
jgi:protocadherin Fat 1/2/3